MRIISDNYENQSDQSDEGQEYPENEQYWCPVCGYENTRLIRCPRCGTMMGTIPFQRIVTESLSGMSRREE
jgi:rubrerythrin